MNEEIKELSQFYAHDWFTYHVSRRTKVQLEKHIAECLRRYDNYLLSVLADIRQKTGVGDKPMLSELADVLADEIKHLEYDNLGMAEKLVRNGISKP